MREVKKAGTAQFRPFLLEVEAIRDFGWAPELVMPIYLMQYIKPQDVIIGTGKSMSVKKLIFHAFKYYNLNYKNLTGCHLKFFDQFFS